MIDDISCASPVGDICGEGAVWHPSHNSLYWTDINRFLVHRYDPGSRSTNTWMFTEPVTSVNLTTDAEQLLLVLASRIALWSPQAHPHIRTIYELPLAPHMRFNDARVDSRGSLWVGTMRNNVGPDGEDIDVEFNQGVLYRIDPNGSISEWKHELGIANTVAWSPDRKKFYFGDSKANTIYSFDFDERTGAISGEKVFLAGCPQGLPDGSAMDADGYLWNARDGCGCVIRIAPDGHIDRTVALPTVNPRTCAFGGYDLKTLYITSGRSADRLSGSLFTMELEVGGLPDGRFQIL
jgi:sugar lactone lactonase YvrE